METHIYSRSVSSFFFLWKPWVFNIYTRVYRVPMVFFLPPWPDLPLLSALGDGILRYSAKITGGWWMNHIISICFSSQLMSSTWMIYELPDITSNLIWVALINMISSSLSWFYLILVQRWQQYGINHCTGHHYPIDPRGFAVPKSWISDDTVFWSVYPA